MKMWIRVIPYIPIRILNQKKTERIPTLGLYMLFYFRRYFPNSLQKENTYKIIMTKEIGSDRIFKSTFCKSVSSVTLNTGLIQVQINWRLKTVSEIQLYSSWIRQYQIPVINTYTYLKMKERTTVTCRIVGLSGWQRRDTRAKVWRVGRSTPYALI